MTAKTEHKAGELAYYDSIAGLIPCKVLEVMQSGDGSIPHDGQIFARVTGRSFPVYTVGTTITTDAMHMVPRRYRRACGFKYRVATTYCWVRTEDNENTH